MTPEGHEDHQGVRVNILSDVARDIRLRGCPVRQQQHIDRDAHPAAAGSLRGLILPLRLDAGGLQEFRGDRFQAMIGSA
jgi:hypothetical protein